METKIKIRPIIIFIIIAVYTSGCVENKCKDGNCQKFEDQEDKCEVISLEEIGSGAFPKISPDGNLVAYTKEVVDNNDPQGIGFEIYIMKINEIGNKCLTCGKPQLKNTRWRGQPYWHPSGEYIVFTAETKKYPRKGIGVTTRPGIGRNHNVWLMKSDGTEFWQLTDYEDNWGVIRPSFSHSGSILYWNEEYQMELYPGGKSGIDKRPGCWWGHESKLFRKGEELCSWRIKLADIAFTNEPKISNIRHINPPKGHTIIEGTGFLPDDKGFSYSSCHIKEQGGRCYWGNIYTTDLKGANLTQLTHDYRKHNENPEFSPDGKKIIWNSSDGDPGEGEEMYLMNADGSNITRLTHFTKKGFPEYDINARQIPESDWSPAGKFIVFAHVSSEREGGLGINIPGKIYILKFKGNCGNSK